MKQKRGIVLIVLVLLLFVLPILRSEDPPTAPVTDPCSSIICSPATRTCSDGASASCTPACSGGICGTCIPDCSDSSDEERFVPNVNKYVSFVASCDGCDDDLDGCTDGDYSCQESSVSCNVYKQNVPPSFAQVDDCDDNVNQIEFKNPHPDGGCWVLYAEDDSDDGDVGYLRVQQGKIISATENAEFDEQDGDDVELGFSSGECNDDGVDGDYTKDADCGLRVFNWKTDDYTYICSDDGYWHSCGRPSEGGAEAVVESAVAGEIPDINTIARANDKLYRCQAENYIPEWVEISGQDLDHDLVPTPNDCFDSGDEPAICSTIDPEASDFDIESICNDLRYSSCAICINPSAPEICGDTIGDNSANDPTDGKGNDCNSDTSNNCDENQAACEQTSRAATLGIDLSNAVFDEEGRAVVEGEELSRADGIDQKNIYNEQFSWTNTNDGGYCCGYGGINDLGKIIDSENGNRICLNRNTDLVGREGDIPNCDDAGDTDGGVNGWCWATAAQKS